MYILGITGPLGHDAAACLMKEGRIVVMVEEERLSRIPHSPGGQMPYLAIEHCLNQEGITLDHVDYIALSWDKSLIPETKIPLPDVFDDVESLFPKSKFPHNKLPKVEVVDHHLAHAASAYYFSPFGEAGVLVADGAGEDCSTTLYHGIDGRLKKLDSIHHNESLGEFYATVTEYVGFDWNDPGKTMGLASFGEAIYDFPRIATDPVKGYSMKIDHSLHMTKVENVWKREMFRLGVIPNKGVRRYNPITYRISEHLEFDSTHRNLAASAQRKLEECYLSLARALVDRTGSRNLCLAGGVALNCVANGKLRRSGLVDDLFIQPAANDAGAAIGAAAEIAARLGFTIEKLSGNYSGPSFTNDQIRATLNHLGLKYRTADDAAELASDLLAEGRTVGWFQGRSEYGPRALGNRSMLANPSVPDIQNHMNRNVKFREGFRPFGPSVLEEEAADFFELMSPSPYMLQSVYVKPDKRSQIGGVVHVDGSSRPQTVTKETNARYHQLITRFRAKTGIPMVLNTSFNLRGEPMVNSPYDAIRTYMSGALDALIMEDILLVKDGINQ
ncbi:carbamoyltransferase C-terminal domain-containing protein [Paenibacillus sp. chi10]|uniref:Carbamoyltransferase C-terminal domain-containing protein n=1 Tax=Paenibacillus suaedae TaxID=3077233 RepID=A0AAJ2JVI0_9BACL|nr:MULTISPECIES: carbamoyltransferase C-terminal domain-containing protein [unclassified Paenibacillus]MDT8977087.1 carbamoyltransferase C-terminal domain-containing protein [Paenibacillus sp. chi10]GAV15986.1 carbamoyltransferase [Paenibacillus sp. NAIST15-1]